MLKLLGIFFAVISLAACSSTVANPEYSRNQIYVNQVGYLPDQEKYFMVDSVKGNFNIISSVDDSIVYSGKTIMHNPDDISSGMTLYIGDFTDFDQEGEFYIEMKNAAPSFPFKINNSIYNDVRDISLRSFYFQRSGIDIPEEYAGKFARKAGHTEPLKYHRSSPISGTKDLTGGWYDAGDYGRYITSASVTLGIMMMGYEQYPEKFDFDNNNIPESGNGISDYLDEIRYELEWMLKMQHKGDDEYKGALPFMVNSFDYDGAMPENATPQYIYEFSSITTADFAAVMSQAYRLYKEIDIDFAVQCLNAAELAWGFIKDRDLYPEDGFIRPLDTVTGGYADSPSYNDYDDRVWASVELFLSTGKQEYHDIVLEAFTGIKQLDTTLSYSNTMGFAGIQYILGKHQSIDTELQNHMKELFLEYCTNLTAQINSDGFKSSLTEWEYVWGANGTLLSRAELLIFAYELTGEKSYYNAALSQLNYVLGLNVNNMSYVSKLGTVYPRNIHHVIFAADGIDDIFPGFVAGGPNWRLEQDHILSTIFIDSTPNAQCYVDKYESYSSNENCILYNAPLTPVAAYFSN